MYTCTLLIHACTCTGNILLAGLLGGEVQAVAMLAALATLATMLGGLMDAAVKVHHGVGCYNSIVYRPAGNQRPMLMVGMRL